MKRLGLKIGETILFCMIALLLAATPAMAETIIYSEGFETNNGGYTHSGALDQWEWGVPTSGPGSAHDGTKLWATNLDGEVPVNSDSYLTSPAISIPALSPGQIARVRFFGWIAIDYMYDRGEFQVSKDGTTWETKAELLYKMSGGWTEYYFDVSDYSNSNIYLRFRLRADGSNGAFLTGQYDMSGLYIDDIAIILSDPVATKTELTLEAWEDQATWASCPWVYTWDGAGYVKDNDVYSTARTSGSEYKDFYKLNKPLVPKDSKYLLELKETQDESSYTDLVQLITIDHSSEVNIASDENGNVLTYGNPGQPDEAKDINGNDVLSQISSKDNLGVKVYNNDYIDIDFSNLDLSNGATLVLNVLGFQADGNPGDPTFEQPYIYIQTKDADGNWITRNKLYPRSDWAINAYDLKAYLTTSKVVRLYVKSCNVDKYHIIDYVGLDTAPQAQITINTMPAISAVHSMNGNVLSEMSISDNTYAQMLPAESIALEFNVPEISGDQVRDFVFVSEGYYEPMGTFFIYTWDGTKWAQRDGWSVEGAGDKTRKFDLSLWLPDPSGEYKVRIWQDYWYEYAGIDYTGLSRGGISGTMISAYDIKKSMYVTSQLVASDNIKDDWTTSSVGYRNRWVEVKWDGLEINVPPTTNPVTISNPDSPAPTIGWIYTDAENNPQAQYEVEVWTGSGGAGTNEWDPAIGIGSDTSVVYAGNPLVSGQTYYARVKAFDGTSWGGWSEASWTVPSNSPPIAEAGGSYTTDEGTSVTFTGLASSDPDGDTLTYAWDLDNDGIYETPGETATITPTDGPATITVGLQVSDGNGGTSTDTATVTVNNVAPTVNAGQDKTANEGDTVSFSGSFTDPGADTHTVAWDFGDGATDSGTLTPSHVYADNGVYTVTLTVTDDDGGVGTDTLTVTVNNVAPTAAISPSFSASVPITLRIAGQGKVGNSVGLDIIQDGAVIASGKITRKPGSPNEQEVTITAAIDLSKPYSGRLVFDTEDALSGGTPVWLITNGNMTKVTTFNTQKSKPASYHQTYEFSMEGIVSLVGAEVTFSGTSTDPGTDDLTFDWAFGDSQTASKLYPWSGSHTVTDTVKHTYSVAGSYTVNLNVADDDGGVGTDTRTIVIS